MGIKVLDCTLRDGAYVVNSKFGKNCISDIISKLGLAHIDIVECGWLRNCHFEPNSVEYSVPQNIEQYNLKHNTKYSLMFDYGRFNIEKLPQNNGAVDIIRIAFYKDNLDGVSFAVEEVLSKGYRVFLQPSNIMEYVDNEILKLCERANFIGVNALYIVDSFGSMFPNDLDRIMPIFSEVTKEGIEIGFHSHNSIQLSFGLTLQFLNYMTRDVIVDSSLCGIGRGAGNTKTELLVEFLNKNKFNFETELIWECIEKNIIPLMGKYNWEYTPNRAKKGLLGIHPDKDI